MKEISPIAGINCKNTMTKISHAEGADHQDITKIIMKEYYHTLQDHYACKLKLISGKIPYISTP